MLTRAPSPRLLAAAIVTLVLAGYGNSLHVPFVYDDVLAIEQNPTLHAWWRLPTVLSPPGGGATVSGRPILNLSLAISYALSGTRPWGYHGVNIAIHAGAALLVFGIIRRTVAGIRGTEKADAAWPALAVASLWAAHPLNTQAVTYAVQRAESLMGMFYLLTLYAFVRAVARVQSVGAVPPPRGWEAAMSRGEGTPPTVATAWLAVSVVACGLGMATKEVMVTAPLLVLLYDRTFVAGSFAPAWRARRAYYGCLAATWLILALLVAGTGLNRGGTVGVGVGVAWWAYPLTQFEAITRYLGLSLWPHPLVFEYGTFWVRGATEILPWVLVVAALLAATVWALRKSPAAGFCGAWFFVILAPTSLAPGTLQMIVEHRMYLPLIAVVTLFVFPLQRRCGRAAFAAVAVLAGGLAVVTHARNAGYRTAVSLWRDTVAKRPLNPRAREALAEAYEHAGDRDAAVKQREIALRLAPGEWTYRFNHALTLAAAGEIADAIVQYRRALAIEPREARTHNNLAILLVRQGNAEAALAHYDHAIRLSPAVAEYHFNRALAQMRLGQPAAAIPSYQEAVRLRPDYAEAHFHLGLALRQQQRTSDGIRHFQEAIRKDPTLVDAHLSLADALLDDDRALEAIPYFRAAIELRPAHAGAHHNLGIAYARLERYLEARTAFEAALRIKPDFADARRSLEQLERVAP